MMAAWMLPAWQGWRMLIANSKLPAVLLAAILYLLLGRKNKKLVIYGAVTAVLCIVPGTAAILMRYQTAFYDYPFVWSIVPVTALIALGGTRLLEAYWEKKAGFRGFVRNAVLIGLCALTLFMSGAATTTVKTDDKQRAEAVLQNVREYLPEARVGDEAPCLWAPRRILEYARMEGDCGGQGSFTLLYGRNMWDTALNAYTYDVYPEEMKALYIWMENAAQADKESTEETIAAENAIKEARIVRTNVEKAFSLGADCVLLPKGLKGTGPESWDRVQVVELEQYYLLIKV